MLLPTLRHQQMLECSLSHLQAILHKMQHIRKVGETRGGARVTQGQAGNRTQSRCKCWRLCRTGNLGACVGKDRETSCLLLQTAGRHWSLPTYTSAKQNPPRKMQAANWVGEILQVLQSAAVRRSHCSLSTSLPSQD